MFTRLITFFTSLCFAVSCNAQQPNWLVVIRDVFPTVMHVTEINPTAEGYGYCSAVNIDAKHGIALTAGHCLKDKAENPDNIILTVNSRPARIIAFSVDPKPDLGLVQFPPVKGDKDIKYTTDYLKMGQPIGVLGLGSGLPVGAQFGYVSQQSNDGDLYMDIMILPGNSGGPVFDQYSRLVGITTSVRAVHGAPFAHLGQGVNMDVILPFLKANGVR